MKASRALFEDKRRLLLVTALLAYTLYTLARTLPQIAYYSIPQGDFGIRDLELHGNPFIKYVIVTKIAPHSAAADAGIRVGDRIEQKSPITHQMLALGQSQPGEVWQLHFSRQGKQKIVTLVARPKRLSAAQIRDNVVGQIIGLLRLILGVMLVGLKPGRLTWLFLVSWTGGGNYTDWFLTFPVWAWFLAALPYTIVIGAVPFLMGMFCLVFPNDELSGWRRRVFPFVVGAAIAGAAFEVARLVSIAFNIYPTPDWIVWVEDIVGITLGSAALIAYYFESRRQGRARWTIPIFAFAIGAVLEDVLALNIIFTNQPIPPWFTTFFGLWETLLTIIFAYAILRRGMFDIEFVLSRSVVFSMLALGGIALFIGIDIGFTALFHGSRTEVALDIALALAIGFAARGLYGRLGDLVDRTFFKRRFEARERLKAVAQGLLYANSTRAIEEILTTGAASALGLASAVFFRRMPDGGFLREVGVGWPPDSPWHLLPDDKLVRSLECKVTNAINLSDLGWSRLSVPAPQEPVIAVPVSFGAQLLGVTLYGRRVDGVLPSSDENSTLVRLAQQAASSYRMLDSARVGTIAGELAPIRIAR